jgi:hypothetical protein
MINTKNAIVVVVNGVESSDTAFELAAENGNRVGLIIANYSTKTLYILFGDQENDVSDTYFSLKLSPNGIYEMPFEYTSALVTGICAAGPTGDIMVTEISDR